MHRFKRNEMAENIWENNFLCCGDRIHIDCLNVRSIFDDGNI